MNTIEESEPDNVSVGVQTSGNHSYRDTVNSWRNPADNKTKIKKNNDNEIKNLEKFFNIPNK